VSKRKLLKKLLSGSRNVSFTDAAGLAEAFGFKLDRVKGSHHIYIHPDIPEIVNLQEARGKAKPYQIRQLLKIIETHNLRMEEE